MTCSFCGLGPPRRERFMAGMQEYAICDGCTRLMTSLIRGEPPPAEVVTRPGVDARLEGADEGQLRRRFAQIVCRFCGRGRAELKPGGVAGPTPETFICPDCIVQAQAELLIS